jgi:hypothetical protein
MSADKQKKKARAFAFIRELGSYLNGFGIDDARMYVNRKPSPIMKYCLKKGYAVLRRENRGGPKSSRTIFDANTERRP